MIKVKYPQEPPLLATKELHNLRHGTMFMANTMYDEHDRRTLYFAILGPGGNMNVYSFERNAHSNPGPFRVYEEVNVDITIKTKA